MPHPSKYFGLMYGTMLMLLSLSEPVAAQFRQLLRKLGPNISLMIRASRWFTRGIISWDSITEHDPDLIVWPTPVGYWQMSIPLIVVQGIVPGALCSSSTNIYTFLLCRRKYLLALLKQTDQTLCCLEQGVSCGTLCCQYIACSYWHCIVQSSRGDGYHHLWEVFPSIQQFSGISPLLPTEVLMALFKRLERVESVPSRNFQHGMAQTWISSALVALQPLSRSMMTSHWWQLQVQRWTRSLSQDWVCSWANQSSAPWLCCCRSKQE